MTAESESSPKASAAETPDNALHDIADTDCNTRVAEVAGDTPGSPTHSNLAPKGLEEEGDDDDDEGKVQNPSPVGDITGVQEISAEVHAINRGLSNDATSSADRQGRDRTEHETTPVHERDLDMDNMQEVTEVQPLTLDALASPGERTPVDDWQTTPVVGSAGEPGRSSTVERNVQYTTASAADNDNSVDRVRDITMNEDDVAVENDALENGGNAAHRRAFIKMSGGLGGGGSLDESTATIDLDERARTPEPTDSELSLLPDDEEDEETQKAFSGRPTTEGFLHTYTAAHFDRASLNSSCSSIYSRNNVGHQGRPYSLYQGKNAFESLINSSAERVLEKIKTRTIDLEPLDSHSHRKMAPPASPRTPPLVPAKARPRKLEPIRTLSTDMQNAEPFGAPLLTPLPPAK